MAQIRTLGEAIAKITDLTNRQLTIERDLKAAKAANLRALQRLAEIEAEGVSANVSFQQDGASAATTLDAVARQRIAINEFLPTGAADDWRTALVAAKAEALGKGGATIWFPRHPTVREIDNTGLGPVIWTGDGIWWEGEGVTASEVENVSTDGTALVEFNGGANSVQWIGWRKLRIMGGAQSGPLITFAAKGISYFQSEYCHWWQKNKDSRILEGTFVDVGGMFESVFRGGWLEHGDLPDDNPTVSAFYVRANENLFSLIQFRDGLRIQCNDNEVPFFDIECTAATTNALRQIKLSNVNVENCTGGLVRAGAVDRLILEDVGYYDPGTIHRHLVELVDGSGGQTCARAKLQDVVRRIGTLAGVTGTDKAGSIVEDSGDTRTIGGAGMVAHGLEVGQPVWLEGAIDEVRTPIVAVTADTIDVVSAGAPTSGSVTVWEAACDLKITGNATGTRVIDSYGTASDPMVIDCDGHEIDIRGVRSTHLAIYRQNKSTSLETRSGTGGSEMATDKLLANELAEWTTGGGVPVTSELHTQAGLVIGSGQDSNDALTKCIRAVVSAVAWGSIAAGAVATQDVTVTGALTQDRVDFAIVASGSQTLGAGLHPLQPEVVAADTIRLKVWNSTLLPLTPTTRNWHFTVWSHQ